MQKISCSELLNPNSKLLVIAGPCQIESLEHALMIAEFLKNLESKLAIQLVYKSSFDKANRTSLKGTRGSGIKAGLDILAKVREKFQTPVLTDVHSESQAEQAGSVVDVLQIPAFLCRQTDLLLAAGKTGKVINIKKGQFLHPNDMKFAAEKVASTGNNNILLCERGSCFGYRDLIVDMRSLVMMRASGYPVVFDATHSVQSMGGSGGASGGSREFIRPLLRAATAVGIQGVFIECHQDPQNAPSDGASMLPLSEVEETLKEVLAIREATSVKAVKS
jgi:2-dehydro-3-deoxyphosphooctonate aldolase (KDO 8-P synthase)